MPVEAARVEVRGLDTASLVRDGGLLEHAHISPKFFVGISKAAKYILSDRAGDLHRSTDHRPAYSNKNFSKSHIRNYS